jgi:chemotaxis signal transduction protein
VNESLSGVAGRAVELRLAFDRSFAEPVRVDTAIKQELLAIRVGAELYAIRLSEITGLFVDKKVTRIPGGDAALLGIVSFRGAMVPVYSLPAMLGHSCAQIPRWQVVAAAAPVAFAFESFEAQLRVAPDAILPQQPRAKTRNYFRDFVRTTNFVGAIIHLPSIIDEINTRRPASGAKEER